MKSKFSDKERELLVATKKLLNSNDERTMSNIIKKVDYFNDSYDRGASKARTKVSSERKKDKLYARDDATILGHFRKVFKRIRKYLDDGILEGAHTDYIIAKNEAYLPRYRVQFEKALYQFLSDDEIKQLENF